MWLLAVTCENSPLLLCIYIDGNMPISYVCFKNTWEALTILKKHKAY